MCSAALPPSKGRAFLFAAGIVNNLYRHVAKRWEGSAKSSDLLWLLLLDILFYWGYNIVRFLTKQKEGCAP